MDGFEYGTLTADLAALLEERDLHEVLVGFSMGGGEVARYLSRYGADRVRRIVFASAVPPYLKKSDDNPDGGVGDEHDRLDPRRVQQDRMPLTVPGRDLQRRKRR